jgi:N-acetyl-gamma-glutamyl-phosphate reductase
MAHLRVAIIGASGYTGEELVRLVSRHPEVELTAVTSRQFAGKPVRSMVAGVRSPLLFEDVSPAAVGDRADVFFLALPHGVAAEYAVPLRAAGKTVIDLSADFRLRDPAVYAEFYNHAHPAPELLKEAVYAAPELHRALIMRSDLLACPGCYPTSIQLAIIPILRAGLIESEGIVINSISGVTGAGKKAELSYLFGEVNENFRAYGVPKHRHLSEIEQELSLAAGNKVVVTFVPHLAPLSRGMHTTISAPLSLSKDVEVFEKTYQEAYAGNPFVEVLVGGVLPEVRNVVGTNRAQVAARVDVRTNRVLLFSVIDNLGKGAAGQAVQVMNIRFGFEETKGLET